MVLLVKEVLLAQLVPSACQVDLALRVPPGPPERREHLVRKDLKVLLVVMVFRVLSVCPGRPDLRVHLERTVTRERLESPVRKEAKPTRENRVLLVPLVSKVPSGPRVPLDLMESLVPEVSRVCLGRREMKAPEVSPDPRVPSVCRGFLDLLVRRERMVTWAPWALMVLPVPEVLRVRVELMVHKALQVVLAPWDQWARRVNKGRPGTQGHKGRLEPGDLKVSEGRKERLAPLEVLDLRVPKDHLEMTVQRATLDPLDSLETLVHLESQVLLALMERPERKERMGRPVKRDLQVHQEKLAHLDHLAREGLWGLLVQRAGKERRAPRVRPVPRVQQAKPDRLDHRDLQESPARRVCVESLVLSVNKDCPALQDKMAPLVPWVLLVFPA